MPVIFICPSLYHSITTMTVTKSCHLHRDCTCTELNFKPLSYSERESE